MTDSIADPPLLAAGVTAYNAADTIERAVNSAVAQTWQPLEVLVVDDGSTDGTRDVLRRLEADFSQVRVILHDSNRGTAVARNTLIAHARGEAIAFFDDDDISDPERIERQWHRLTAYERQHGNDVPILCHVSRSTRGPDGRSELRRALGSSTAGSCPHGPDLVAHLLWGAPLEATQCGVTGTGAQLGRISTYRTLGGFDPRFRRAQDSELNVRLARAGGHLIGVDEPLLEQHLTRTSDKASEVALSMQMLLLTTHRHAFPDAATYAATRRWWQAWHLLRGGEAPRGLRALRSAMLLAPRVTARRVVRELLPKLWQQVVIAHGGSRRNLRAGQLSPARQLLAPCEDRGAVRASRRPGLWLRGSASRREPPGCR